MGGGREKTANGEVKRSCCVVVFQLYKKKPENKI